MADLQSVQDIKALARKCLRSFYWPALLVCMVIIGFTGVSAVFSGFGNHQVFRAVQVIVLAVLLQFFIVGPLLVGQAYFFLRSIDGDVKVSNLFVAFHLPHYWNIAVISTKIFLRILLSFVIPVFILGFHASGIGVFITLLLFIPGIMLIYRYRLIPFVLANDLQMPFHKVLGFCDSIAIHRLRRLIFFIDLSFAGWYILGLLAFGIGAFFVVPFHQSSMATLYNDMKELVYGHVQKVEGTYMAESEGDQ